MKLACRSAVGLGIAGLLGGFAIYALSTVSESNPPIVPDIISLGLPSDVGDWHSVRLQNGDLGMVESDGVTCLSRNYTNHDTGQEIAVALLCGRMPPVAMHTPADHYETPSSFFLLSRPERIRLIIDGSQHTFRVADFKREEGSDWKNTETYWKDTEKVRIFWTFTCDGNWECPNNPRFEYIGHSDWLCKLYFFGKSTDTTDVETGFLSAFLPELNTVLFPIR